MFSSLSVPALLAIFGGSVGNVLGGIAIQTVVLAALDRFGMREDVPLTYRTASLTLMIGGCSSSPC